MRIDQADDDWRRPAADNTGVVRGAGRADLAAARADADHGAATDRGDTASRHEAVGRADGASPDGTAGRSRTADRDSTADRDRDNTAGQQNARGHEDTRAIRVARAVEYRATVDAAHRAHAIDQGYARIREIERGTVTPAMRRIEAEDPTRHLAGLEHRLKGKDRLTEKVERSMAAQPDLRPDDAFRLVKDAIRYTFVYDETKYSAGVYADCDRLESAGFEPVDRQNSWKEDQYKGINGRWRDPGSGYLFEVQFHTQESLDAKEHTHPAYERIRDTSTPPEEVKELRAYQREVCARIPIPPGATEVPDYNYL